MSDAPDTESEPSTKALSSALLGVGVASLLGIGMFAAMEAWYFSGLFAVIALISFPKAFQIMRGGSSA